MTNERSAATEEQYALPLPLDLEQPTPNASLPIYAGRMSASAYGITLDGDAVVEVRWTPEPALVCHIDFDPGVAIQDLQRVIAGDPNQEIELRVPGGSGRARRRGGNWLPDSPWAEYRIYDVLTINTGADASEVRFELVNMEDVYGAPVSYGEYSWGADLLQLSSSRWSIDLQAVRDLRPTIETLQQTGGYAVTHTGRASLRDGAGVEPSDAKSLMTTLQYTLSFAEDRWITPVRTRGLTTDGGVAWELWGLWNTAPWSMPMTWFSRRSVDGLNEVFRAIDNRWSDEYWERLPHTSIHYYLEASHGLVNRQVIMAGALLELIGWHVVVEDRKLLSGNGFDRRDASDRIRMLLELMCYPLDIPLELPAVRGFAKPTWDIADVLTEVRHSVVHAKRHRAAWEMDDDTWVEVSSLSQEICNAAMLYLLEYQGNYVNQLTARFAADEWPVPWTPAK